MNDHEVPRLHGETCWPLSLSPKKEISLHLKKLPLCSTYFTKLIPEEGHLF